MAESCIACGQPKIILRWNSSVNVLVCNTTGCRLYRQPTATSRGTPTLAEELGRMHSRYKRRPKGKKYAAFTFEERLQELRDEISA